MIVRSLSDYWELDGNCSDRPMRTSAWLQFTAAVLSAGCASVSIDDLQLSSISVVDRRSQLEIPAPGDIRLDLARMTGDPNLGPQIGTSSVNVPHELLIKAEFTSRVDFSKIDYRDNLDSQFFFCERPDAHVRIGLPYVYWNRSVVPATSTVQRQRANTAELPLVYYVFFRVAVQETKPSKPPVESFDLRQNVQDVCFRLVGGQYRALGYTSNTVTVPKAAISKTLLLECRLTARC
jgi:hypothetical protein